MRKLLILGGSEAQVPLILEAKREGYYVVLCDWTTTNPGIPFADKHYQVSTLDLNAVLDVAKKECVNGVISNSEPAMENVAAVASELGLVGNSVNGINLLQSKSRFRLFQKENGLFCPKSIEIDSIEALKKALKELTFPIIIKPSNSSGSRGTAVFNAYDIVSITEAFAICSNYSTDDRVVVEEYVPMPLNKNIGGDIFVHNGEIIWDGLATSIRYPYCKEVPVGEFFPIEESEKNLIQLKQQIQYILEKNEIRHGAYNIEAYYTQNGELFIVEINVRQGGNDIPHLIKDYCGIDMYKLLVTSCVGDDSYFDEVVSSKYMNRYITNYVVLATDDTRFNGITIDDGLLPYVYSVKQNVEKGKILHKAKNAMDSVAMIRMQFPDRRLQLEYNFKYDQLIRIE